MKMTVTLTAEDIKDIVRREVARRLSVPPERISTGEFKLKKQYHGDQRESWTTESVESISYEVQGDKPTLSTDYPQNYEYNR